MAYTETSNTAKNADHDVFPIDHGSCPTKLSALRRQRDHALMRELRNQLEKADCFKPATFAYLAQIGLILAVGVICFVALLSGPELPVRIALLGLLAIATVQAGFVAHDAGDGGVTKNKSVSFFLRHTLMSFVAALSSSYFDYLHRVHHLTINRGARGLGAQPFATNPYEISWFKRAVSWNGIVFLVATTLMRGVTFRLESIRYLWRNRKNSQVDGIFMGLHWLVWLALPLPFIGVIDTLVNYVLVALLAGPYVGTVLILNHEGMSHASSLGHLSLLERVTRSTRNLGSSRWSDIVFGGVNNHIEHHLFQQIPTARLRRAREITSDFCHQHKIKYVETSFFQACKEAVKHFRSVPSERLVIEALS